MKAEIICAIISVGGVLLSTLGSMFVSRIAASKEIKKLKLEFEHNDNATLAAELSDALAAAAKYSSKPITMYRTDAVSKIAAVRVRYGGELGRLLDVLYSNLSDGNCGNIDRTLALLVEEKRKCEADHGIHS